MRDLHPFTPDELAQGALQVMYELERSLSSLFGMAAFSLNPSAGAHAELAALLIAKKYFKERGETARDKVIVPDTAHGTNPASAAMCGFKVISLPSDERGRVSVDEIKKVLGPDTAVCMMTNPNTLGLFEDHIAEIAAAVHAAGGLMYYDGANANAIMGNVRPGDMGFDLMHLNTHKTFTIPHGGGGAGHGPVGVAAHLVDYLPTPVVVATPDPNADPNASRRRATGCAFGSTSTARNRSDRCVRSGRTSRTPCARSRTSTPTAKTASSASRSSRCSTRTICA